MSKHYTDNPPRPFRLSINVSDLIADTLYLSPAEFGCYMRLLLAYWRTGPAKNDDRVLARIAGMTLREWSAVRPKIAPFFDIAGEWIHWRLDAELEAAYVAINANRKRTQAATAARKERCVRRDVERNVGRTEHRDGPLDVVQTGSKDQKAPSQGDGCLKTDADRCPPEWDDDLRDAEDRFMAGESDHV